jgi:hypothetical protein
MIRSTTPFRRISSYLMLVLLAVFATLVFSAGSASASMLDESVPGTGPAVWSDQSDYEPGSTVTLTGAGWQPGESVHIFVNDDTGVTWSRNVDIKADPDGQIGDVFALPDWLVAVYKVTAIGTASGQVTMSFTDAANLKVNGSDGSQHLSAGTEQNLGSISQGSSVSAACPSNGLLASVTGNPTGTLLPWTLSYVSGYGSNATLSPATTLAPSSGTFSGNGNACVGMTIATSGLAPGQYHGELQLTATGANSAQYFFVFTVIASNSAPAIARNTATVNVNEGAAAANTGTWSDANAGDVVTLTASVGSVTKSGTNAAGTWSWSFGTTDGPAQSQTVTITANDGTTSTSTTFQLNVANVAPIATFNAPGSVDEGSNINLSLTSASDPSSADTTAGLAYAFDCGSGYGPLGATSIASCTTSDNGTRSVRGEIKDKDGGITEYTASVTIGNVDPTGTLANSGPIDEGSSATISFTSPSDVSSADAAGLHFAFDCSGASLATATYASSSATNGTSCSFADNGSFTVSGAIIDKDGGRKDATTEVIVSNVAPTATFNAPASVDEGGAINLSLSNPSDPSSADTTAGFSYAFDCGSGYGAFSATATAGCATSDNGSRSVGAKIRDKDGGTSTYTANVAIDNVDPNGDLANDGPVDEGSPVNVSFSSPDDASSVDAASLHYAFDCSGAGLDSITYALAGTANTKPCSFGDNGSYTVSGVIIDKDGGRRKGSTDVTVDNAAPIVHLTGDGIADEGSTHAYSFTIGDPGDDSFSFAAGTPDCGTGGVLVGAPVIADGTFSCRFPDGPATPAVSLQVNDGTDDSAAATVDVSVQNIAPKVVLSGDTDVSEGSTHTYTFTVSDAGNDGFAATDGYPDCDNGSTNSGVLVDDSYQADALGGSFQCFFADGPATANVKIRAQDSDGASGTDSESVQVVAVANVAPAVTAAADQSGGEGSSKSFDLGSFTDPGPDAQWQVNVNWGDGSADTTFDAAGTGTLDAKIHTYDDNGGYTVTVKVTDKDDEFDAKTFHVTVDNVAPTATFHTPAQVDEGGDIALSLSDPRDPSAADTNAGFSFAFDCGAGYGSFGPSDSASCPTADNGSRPVAARIRDKDGAVSTYTADVTIDNVAPVVTAPDGQSGEEGSATSFALGSFNDAGANDAPWSVNVNWGDGTTDTTFATSSTGAIDANDHSYDDNGSYTVTETVTDKDGGADSTTFQVTVANVDPTFTLANAGPANEGSPVTITTSGAGDPSNADTTAGFHYSFTCDGLAASLATSYADAAASDHSSCAFADDGTYTVRARIFDKNDGSTTEITTVTVDNVSPTITAAADQTSDEGSSKAFDLGSFGDPGSNDNPWAVDINWGDATSHATFNAAATGSLGTRSHSYDDNGSYTVTVTVTDKDSGADTAIFHVTVANVDPSGTLANGGAVDEGSPATISFTSPADASSADAAHLQFAFDCGGASLAGVGYGDAAAGATNSKHCTYPDDGTHAVSGVILDKDGGRHAGTTTVTVKNVSPNLTAPADQIGSEGSAEAFDLGSFGDPGTTDGPWGVDVNWGDGSAHTGFTSAAAGTLGTRSHSYDDNGTYTVTVQVTDKDSGTGSVSFQVAVSNVAPTFALANAGPVNEGSPVAITTSGAGDPSTADATAGFHYSFACNGLTASLATVYAGAATADHSSCSFADNGSYTVKARIIDKDNGYTTQSTIVSVNNVAPFNVALSGTATYAGPLAFMPSTFTTTFSDPGSDTWGAAFTWPDGSPLNQAINPFASGQSAGHTFTTASCTKTVAVTVSDDDGGSGSATATIRVGTAAFLAPMTNQPVTNKLKNGQVLPVKIQITDCNGVAVTGLSPAIRLLDGDQTAAADDSTAVITPSSVSAADATGVMRADGSAYIYNMRINLAKLSADYTIVIYPFGTDVPSQTLRHVIQATK